MAKIGSSYQTLDHFLLITHVFWIGNIFIVSAEISSIVLQCHYIKFYIILSEFGLGDCPLINPS